MHPIDQTTEAEYAARAALDESPPPARKLREVRVPFEAVAAGRTTTYKLAVQNGGKTPLFDVVVRHSLPTGATLLRVTPSEQRQAGRLEWPLGDLAPGSRSDVVLEVRAGDDGLAGGFAVFQVEFQTVAVERRPWLGLSVKAPEVVSRGRPIAFRVQLSNTGQGPAHAVQVRGHLAGQASLSGGSTISKDVPLLAAGQTEELIVTAVADAEGLVTLTVEADCAERGPVLVSAAVRVEASRLEVRPQGPAKGRTGEPLGFQVVVVNRGYNAVEGVRLACRLPMEVAFRSAGEGGAFDPAAREVVWDLTGLAAGDTREVSLQLNALVPGECLLDWTTADAWSVEPQAATALTIDLGRDESSNLLERLLAEMDREMAPEGPARRSEAVLPVLGSEEAEGERFVIFTLAGIDYAISAEQVIEVGRPAKITKLPNVPEWMLGLTNVRGDIVSVVDLRGFLGLGGAGAGPNARMLIVKTADGEMITGLMLDRVRGIRRLARDSFQPAAAIEDARLAPFVQGAQEYRESLLVALDLDRLLSSPELQQFELV